ncbi:SurA N-terminal domain-containing protein [Celerinatantimonas yamalensis]|uniref:Periplasmic chaperone PpiD n=1 Tax=Celerinatantimonas yamalensis TaxID=559956 RepID=A0ABW9G3I2_9GAMM
MLDKIQEGGQSLVIKIILGLIIVSFALAGIGSYVASPSASYAAKVNGDVISQAEFQQAYQNERQQMQSRFGSAFLQLADNPQYMAQLKKNVLQRLVDQKLIDQQSKAMRISVSDAQVKQAILAMAAFQKDGHFDNATFRQRLATAGLTPARFSQLIRKDLMNQQLQSALFATQFTLPNEVTQLANLQSQTRQFSYVAVPGDKFADDVKVTDKELNNYYQAHLQQFRSPEMVSFNYILVDAKQLAKTIQVSDQQAQSYLNNHANDYQLPAQRHVAHILIKFGKDPAQAKAKAEAIEKQLKDGADFAALAKKDSQDTFSAKKGGVLDWFQKGVMPANFDKAAFGLAKVGDISSVVKTKYGYHIIKLLGIQNSKMPSLDSVKAKVVKKIQQDQAMTQFYDLSQKLSNLSFEMPDSLDQVAKQMGVKVLSATNVTRANLPGDLQNPEVVKQVFSQDAIEKKQNSNVINLSPEQAVVVRLTGHQAAKTQPFDKVKDQVTKSFVAQQQLKLSQAYAKKLLAAIANPQQFAQLIQAKGLQEQQVKAVTRNDQELDPQLLQQVFSMPHPKAGKEPSQVVQLASGDSYVVKLLNVAQPKPDAKLDGQIAQKLQGYFVNEDYRLLLDYLKSKANIEYNG